MDINCLKWMFWSDFVFDSENRFEEEYQLAGVCFLFSGFSGGFLGFFFGIRLKTDRFKEEFLDCV